MARPMNDDGEPATELETLKAEHRRLDLEISMLASSADADQLEIARLKKRKLQLKDQIHFVANRSIPDIIA